MDFETLPSLVKENVLRCIIEQNSECLYTWKKSMPLMGVCREWRQVARHHMFKTAFIENNDGSSDKCRKNFSTNIDLIAKAGGMSMVKVLDLHFREHKLSTASFVELHNILSFNAIQWSSVKFIRSEMFFDYETRRVDANYEYVFEKCPQLERLMSRFSAKVVQHMPNVVSIKHKSHKSDGIGQIFSNKLVNFYAAQLQRIECYPEVKFAAPRLSNNLEYIHVYPDPSCRTFLPEINPRPLKKLILSDLSSNFSWKCFRNNEDSLAVSFSNLVCLELSFTRTFDDIESAASRLEAIRLGNSEQYDVSLPKLKSLYITGNPIMPEMITSANLPSRMASVTVAESLENLSLCTMLNTKSIDSLKVVLNMNYYDSQETFYRVTNSMFGKSSICNKVSLELRNIHFDLDVERIDWSKVTELTIGNPITYLQLTGLLPRLTNLQELVVSQFSCSGIDKEMLDVSIESLVEKSLKSLSNSLQSVWFLNIAEDSSHELAALCVQRLLPQLPSLLNVKSFYCQADALEDFAYYYQDYFPHLVYINIID